MSRHTVRAGHARPRPGDPLVGRAPPVELHAVAGRLRRAVVPRASCGPTSTVTTSPTRCAHYQQRGPSLRGCGRLRRHLTTSSPRPPSPGAPAGASASGPIIRRSAHPSRGHQACPPTSTRSSTSPRSGASCSSRPRSTAVCARPTTTGRSGWRCCATSRTSGGGRWCRCATTSWASTRRSSSRRGCGRRRATSPRSPTRWWSAPTATTGSGSTSSTIPTSARRAASADSFTEPKQFNLMFRTHMGPVEAEGNLVYLRPETAQGIFINYENVRRTSRLRLPFGIAQIGKAFRNEITPGQFVFRTREFEQMEMEYFCRPEESAAVVRVLAAGAHALVHRPGHGPGAASGSAPTPPTSCPTTRRAPPTSSTCSRGVGTSSRASPAAPTST